MAKHKRPKPVNLKDYFEHAKAITIPNMDRSRTVISMLVGGLPTPQECLEIGAAVLLDKPIIMCIDPGTPVPANVKRVATAIIEGNPLTDPEGMQQKITQAMREILSSDKRTH